MNEIPTWTIVLGIIGLLVNAVIGLLIWAASQKLGDIKESIINLIAVDRELANKVAAVDRELGNKVGALAKELSDHKLHVSETYVRLELHTATTTSIFNALREAKNEIVERVQELMQHLETRLREATERS